MSKKSKAKTNSVNMSTVARTSNLMDAAENLKDCDFLFDKEANVLYIKTGRSLMKVTETADTEKMKHEIAAINNKLAFGYEQDKKLNEYIRQNATLINELTEALKLNEAMDNVEADKLNKARAEWLKATDSLESAVIKNNMVTTANAEDVGMNTYNDGVNLKKAKKFDIIKTVVIALAIAAVAIKAFLF